VPVQAAMAADGISYYSRRQRPGSSGERFPAGGAGGRMAGTPATCRGDASPPEPHTGPPLRNVFRSAPASPAGRLAVARLRALRSNSQLPDSSNWELEVGGGIHAMRV